MSLIIIHHRLAWIKSIFDHAPQAKQAKLKELGFLQRPQTNDLEQHWEFPRIWRAEEHPSESV